MAFDIKIHITDHAHQVIDQLKNKKDTLLHFNTSCDIAYFINTGYDTQEKIDRVMSSIMDNITKKELRVKEKNGVYTNKDGLKKQKYRTRTIKFDMMMSAYHNRHFDASKSVNPHFHFLFSDKARMGKDYMYLRQALADEAEKYHIKFNFMEEKQNSGLTKHQQQMMKRLSWNLHQGDNKKMESYFAKTENIKNHLDALTIHYQHTKNLSYFLKSILIIHQRLQELDLDYYYGETNLKENIFFFLSDEQKSIIKKLERQEEIEINFSSVLEREIVKSTYGFKSEVMNILTDKFNLLPIDKNKLKLNDKHITPSTQPKEKKSNLFRELIIQDLRNAIARSKNEKDIKILLTNSGSYTKVSTKSQKVLNGKRKKVGFELTTKNNMTISISLAELKLNWSKITMILMHNSKKNKFKKQEKSESNIEKYKNEKDELTIHLTRYEYNVKLLLSIYTNQKAPSISKNNINILANKFNISTSKMYGITTYENNDTSIIDTGDKVTLKKSHNIQGDVANMLDIAELKGWKLASLVLQGSQEFKDEMNKQVSKRAYNYKVTKLKI